MNPFAYGRASSAEEAIAAAARDRNSAYLAGGTTLVDLMKLEVVVPRAVIDVDWLPMRSIQPTPSGGLAIGAMVRNSDLAAHPEVRRRFPVLSEALLSGASPQIRNMASVGGNLLQRTRCPYFRDVHSPCNKREPGSGCSAQDGYNRMHAILGGSSRCIATYPGDMAVALNGLDAVVRTRGAGGRERRIPIGEFHVPYGEDPARETLLEHAELITAVELPAVPWFSRSRYVKVRDRASYDFALASAAVALDLVGGRIREARVALGGIATKPWRSREAEQALAGARPEEAAYRAAADAALAGAQPQKHNGFKVELAKRTLVRALAEAARGGAVA